MSLKSQLYKSIRGMPHCIAGGYIDLDAGVLIDMLTARPESKDMLPRLVGITEDLFQGPNVRMIEEKFNKARGIEAHPRRLLHEVVVMNDDLIHVFIRGARFNNHVVTFIFEGSANMGLVLYDSRNEVPLIENEVGLLREPASQV